MKYNLATDLISTELIPWADEYEPSEPITEYWPPALWSDVAQTRAEYESGVITDPTSQVDIKYIYSRKYRPYALFTQHWNTMDPKIVHGVNGYAIHAKVGVGTITEIIAKYTEVTSLAVNVSANITSVSADSITATNVSSTIEIVHQLSGVNINKYRTGEFHDAGACFCKLIARLSQGFCNTLRQYCRAQNSPATTSPWKRCAS